ncbi:hypothetical protein NDU88_001854 [Pleurodeles waltl]|uniref:Uncharacterized protein n=1 Tax=Pleurodeles waltl TaxID=8319 RepID=A0AAV7Q754_PLEWA|nr:hypothetical protein NDU88_001854 [Pleurodeles waltl]
MIPLLRPKSGVCSYGPRGSSAEVSVGPSVRVDSVDGRPPPRTASSHSLPTFAAFIHSGGGSPVALTDPQRGSCGAVLMPLSFSCPLPLRCHQQPFILIAGLFRTASQRAISTPQPTCTGTQGLPLLAFCHAPEALFAAPRFRHRYRSSTPLYSRGTILRCRRSL